MQRWVSTAAWLLLACGSSADPKASSASSAQSEAGATAAPASAQPATSDAASATPAAGGARAPSASAGEAREQSSAAGSGGSSPTDPPGNAGGAGARSKPADAGSSAAAQGGKAGAGGAAGAAGGPSMLNGTGSCCSAHTTPGCGDADLQVCVCEKLPSCCTDGWTQACAYLVTQKYCQPGVRECVCGMADKQWGQAQCCDQQWGSACDSVAELKCGAASGCR